MDLQVERSEKGDEWVICVRHSLRIVDLILDLKNFHPIELKGISISQLKSDGFCKRRALTVSLSPAGIHLLSSQGNHSFIEMMHTKIRYFFAQ
jgi:hypothetical protein